MSARALRPAVFLDRDGTINVEKDYLHRVEDFAFIPGGVVPGVLVLKPDYPENMDDWPFLWGENEYVISIGASYVFLANAAQELLSG